jgi:predicted RNase H-like nuclease
VLPDAAVQHSGRTLKDIEDRLDAAACAVAAFHAWKFGAAGLEVFGDVQNGYIAVPKRD